MYYKQEMSDVNLSGAIRISSSDTGFSKARGIVLQFSLLIFSLVHISSANAQISDLEAELSLKSPKAKNNNSSNSVKKAVVVPQSTSSDKIQYDFIAGFGGNFYGDEKQQEQTAAAMAYSKVQYKPISFAEFDLFAGFNLITGHSQYRYGDSESHSGFSFKEAAIRLTPINHFKFGIGALSVQSFPIPSLLVSEVAFPGVSEEIMFGTTNQHIQVFAEQMIPTSSSLSTQTAEQESTPGFYTEGIDLRSPLFHRDLISGLYFGHFKFSNLPGSVANQSALYGNSVYETGPNSSQFHYGFDGYFGGVDLSWRMNRSIKLSFGEHIISNSSAPSDSRLGQVFDAKLEYQAHSDLIITPSFESFFNESDSSPAYFNSAEYGHNNMEGFGGHLKIEFPKERFYARADYYNANLINQNSSQYNQQFFFLRFVTEYGNSKLF